MNSNQGSPKKDSKHKKSLNFKLIFILIVILLLLILIVKLIKNSIKFQRENLLKKFWKSFKFENLKNLQIENFCLIKIDTFF